MGLQNGKIAALPFVTADLNYLTPSANRPRNYTFEPPSGEPKSNIVPEPHGLPIHDVRPISDAVSLDREGFALVQQISAVRDFYNEDQVKRVYYPEAERLIKAATGATLKVIGSSIAMVASGPIPGRTPMSVPTRTPMKQ